MYIYRYILSALYIILIISRVYCTNILSIWHSGVPGAGKYNTGVRGGTDDLAAFMWSTSTYKRFQNMGMDNKV